MQDRTDWPLPASVTVEATLRRAILNCARPAGRARVGVIPRWSAVSKMTGHGSGYSAELCRWAGVDPNEAVVRR